MSQSQGQSFGVLTKSTREIHKNPQDWHSAWLVEGYGMEDAVWVLLLLNLKHLVHIFVNIGRRFDL